MFVLSTFAGHVERKCYHSSYEKTCNKLILGGLGGVWNGLIARPFISLGRDDLRLGRRGLLTSVAEWITVKFIVSTVFLTLYKLFVIRVAQNKQ